MTNNRPFTGNRFNPEKPNITVRRMTQEEAESDPNFYGKFRDNYTQETPDEDVKDDYQAGDRNVFDKGVIVTKTRDFNGYKIQRRNPYGFYYVLNLENELGTFTGQKEAQDALIAYLRKAHDQG